MCVQPMSIIIVDFLSSIFWSVTPTNKYHDGWGGLGRTRAPSMVSHI